MLTRPISRAAITSGNFIRRRPLGGVSGIVILLMFAAAIFAPWISRADPLFQHAGRILEGPSWDFWMGTDHLGRDIYSRIVHGAKVSITVGFVAVAIGTGAGSVIGLVSGFQGGKLDLYVQRFIDAWIAFPGLVLILVLVSMLGPSLLNVSIAIGIGAIPGTSRLVRSAVLTTKENEYIVAAQAIGATRIRVGATAHFAKRHGSHHHSFDRFVGRGDPGRVVPELPWPGSAASRADMGRDALAGGTRVHDRAAFVGPLAGHRHYGGGDGLQPFRGRPARRLGPTVEGGALGGCQGITASSSSTSLFVSC